jgi:hypothetical protein
MLVSLLWFAVGARFGARDIQRISHWASTLANVYQIRAGPNLLLGNVFFERQGAAILERVDVHHVSIT